MKVESVSIRFSKRRVVMLENFRTVFIIIPAMATVIGCSTGNPLTMPNLEYACESEHRTSNGIANTYLWGYYDVFIDIENLAVDAVPDRTGLFTANVVNFINSMPAGLSFHINGTNPGAGHIDIDIDVSITHPFPGMPQFNGYDVRGVFMGDGFGTLSYNNKLKYPVDGTDQFMIPDPVDGIGGPDGYTRWFNKPEFSTGGMPLFSYTQGNLATPGFNGTATLNAYRYFADGLPANADLWTFLTANNAAKGVFSSGAKNTRNYYLRFPDTKGVKYGYAIIANWEGPDIHPSNAPEAVACKVIDNSDLYYVDPSVNGGNLILDLSFWNWGGQPSKIFIESTVLTSPHEFTPDQMVPVAGDENYSTYHAEIPADNVTGISGHEYWVIAQYDDFDYKNDFGTTNLAGDDPLASFFRYSLTVSDENPEPPCKNIPLRDDALAVDIAIDPSNGDLLVLYEDKTVYRYEKNDCYQNGAHIADVTMHISQIMYAIEIAPNGYYCIALTYVTPDTPGLFIFDFDNNFKTYFGMAPPKPLDAFALNTGPMTNDMGFIKGWVNSTTGYEYTRILRTTPKDDDYGYGLVYDFIICLLYTSPSPRDRTRSRMPSSA